MHLNSLFNVRSGQGTIATVFLFMVVIMMTIFTVVLTSELGTFNQEVDVQINNRVDEVRVEAVVSSILNDQLWRAEDIDEGKYNGNTAKEVASYYFSTSGDTIHLGEDSIAKSEVGNDLESYFDYMLSEYWSQGTDSHAYWLKMEHGENNTIEVQNGEFSQDPSQRTRSNFVIGLTNGETADATLVIEETGSESNVPDIRGAP